MEKLVVVDVLPETGSPSSLITLAVTGLGNAVPRGMQSDAGLPKKLLSFNVSTLTFDGQRESSHEHDPSGFRRGQN